MGAALGFSSSKVLAETPKEYYSDFKLGKYVKHILTTDIGHNEQLFELNQRGPYHRFVNFPVETRLEILYEKGRESYLAWNINKDDLKNIASMNISQLLKYNVDWKDSGWMDYETGKYIQDIDIPCIHDNSKKNKFRLSCVTLKK